MIRDCNFFLGAAAPTPHYVAPPLLMKLSPSQVPTVAHNLVQANYWFIMKEFLTTTLAVAITIDMQLDRYR